jgi:ABC-2 type transport system permease protein
VIRGLGAGGWGTAASSSRAVAAAPRRAVATHDASLQMQIAARKDCIAHVPPDQADEQCPPAQLQPPPVSAFYQDPRWAFTDHLSDLLHATVLIGSLAALLMSASVIGAEWQAGTFATLLTWEPRRLRVAAAKVTAAVLGSLAVVAVAGALLVGTGALMAATRGAMHSVLQDSPFQQVRVRSDFAVHMWAMAGRGACVVALLAAVGAGLALLLRNTVAALGVVIGYLIVGEAVIGSLRHGDVRHHLIQSRLAALVDGSYRWFTPVRGAEGSVSFSPDNVNVVHALAAGLELLALVVVLLAAAALVFRRRDVT